MIIFIFHHHEWEGIGVSKDRSDAIYHSFFEAGYAKIFVCCKKVNKRFSGFPL